MDLLRGASLLLDFDGTLVEIAERPDGVVVAPQTRVALRRLHAALDGRLAIVSGRPLDELAGFIGIAGLPLGGSHGAEMIWPDGRRTSAEPPAWRDSTLSRVAAFAAARPGVFVEAKPFGVALHYRQAPDAARACERFAESLAGLSDIRIQKGKMVVELRAPGDDKGDALRAFMNAPPMCGTRPVFVGDDDTDEAAFAAARMLGGAGILVGDDRPTAAAYRLADVAATLAWLEAAATAA